LFRTKAPFPSDCSTWRKKDGWEKVLNIKKGILRKKGARGEHLR